MPSSATLHLELLNLDEWLLAFSRSMIHLPQTAPPSHRVPAQHALLVYHLHVVYHKCRLVLHASYLPQFGGKRWSPTEHQGISNISIQAVMDSARSIYDIAAEILSSKDIDVPQVSSFVGHGMYLAACVFRTIIADKNATPGLATCKDVSAPRAA